MLTSGAEAEEAVAAEAARRREAEPAEERLLAAARRRFSVPLLAGRGRRCRAHAAAVAARLALARRQRARRVLVRVQRLDEPRPRLVRLRFEEFKRNNFYDHVTRLSNNRNQSSFFPSMKDIFLRFTKYNKKY